MGSDQPGATRKPAYPVRIGALVACTTLLSVEAAATGAPVHTTTSTTTSSSVSIGVPENATNFILGLCDSVFTPPVHGSASASGGNCLYTPAADYAGPDSLVDEQITVSTQTIQIGDVILGFNTNTNSNFNTVNITDGVAVPTMGEWALLAFGLTLGGAGLVAGRDRKTS